MSRAPLLLAACLALSCRAAPPAQDPLFSVIPANALAAVVVRANALMLVRQQLEQSNAMQRELSDYLVKQLNLDPSKLSAVAAFTTAPDAKDGAAFLVMPIKGEPKWPKVTEPDGTVLYRPDPTLPIFVATAPGGLIVGTEQGAMQALAVASHKAPALGKGSPLESLLSVDPTTTFALAVSSGASEMAPVKMFASLYGISTVVAGYAPGHVFAWASGDAALLGGARDAIKGLVQLGLDQAKEAKDKAVSGDDTFAGAAAIVSYHQYAEWSPKILPRLDGNRLIVDVALPSGKDDGTTTMMVGVATAGVLAAVAVPAYMKYIRRSKTVEATMNLRKLYDSEISYYESEHASAKGEIFHGFTGSTDWTPRTPCSKQPEGTCQPDPATFAGSPWEELNFSMDYPYYYQYRVSTTKTGFVVEARGDLDGDGQFSLFRRTGTIDAQGNVSGGTGLYTENEIE